MLLNRPPTSKPRGICKYYATPRGCFAGNSCKFLHGDPSASLDSSHGYVFPQALLTPYDAAKTCKYFANGYCKRGADCWFRHVIEGPATRPNSNEDEDEDLLCSICLEKPVTFGLLGGCSHVFCIQCVRKWRDPANKSGDLAGSANIKTCPMCRSPSRFIIPSSRFWKQGEEGKANAMRAYLESTARVSCRYFEESKVENPKKPLCPFGKDCFYQHLNDDGTHYTFKDGADVCMKRLASKQRQANHVFNMSRRTSSDGIQLVAFDVEHDIDGVHVTSDLRDRTWDAAVALSELERNLDDVIINENLDTDASIELSLLRESIVENIALLLRQADGESDDVSDGTGRLTSTREMRASASSEIGYDNSSFAEQLHTMTQQFIASIRDNSRNRSNRESLAAPITPGDDLSSPPPLESYEDDSLSQPESTVLADELHGFCLDSGPEYSPVPPFVTDGRGRVVWSEDANRTEADVR